jgi:hypothetical protein
MFGWPHFNLLQQIAPSQTCDGVVAGGGFKAAEE